MQGSAGRLQPHGRLIDSFISFAKTRNTESMKPKAFIFDFDGVIVDSLAIHFGAWASATRAVFNRELPDPTRFAGLSTRVIGALIAKELGHSDRAADLVAEKQRRLKEFEGDISPFPGVREMFSKLEQQNRPFGIATNAPRAFLEGILKMLKLSAPCLVALEDSPRPKPAPDPYIRCSDLMGLSVGDRSQTVVFEDSTHGLAAAASAGMIPVGVTSQSDAATLVEAGALFTIKNIAEFLERGWDENLA